MQRIRYVGIISLTVMACALQSQGYDPDWDGSGPAGSGKLDSLLDDVQELGYGQTVTGNVGGERMELYQVEVGRRDRIAVEMTVTDGDLAPHISIYEINLDYIHSESWSRDGDTLRKEYLFEDDTTILVAARAYRSRGSGSYELAVTCAGGYCAGEYPPWHHLTATGAATCISRARSCAQDRLGSEGTTDAAVAREILDDCLRGTALESGEECARACEWRSEYDSSGPYDDAEYLCARVAESLAFLAGQPPACEEVLEGCLSSCRAESDRWYDLEDEGIYYTLEGLCFTYGFNGTCDGFARSHEACGGAIAAGGAVECFTLCRSTVGALWDDIDGFCRERDCASRCDVEINRAAGACGGLSEESLDCLEEHIAEADAGDLCEDALRDAVYEG